MALSEELIQEFTTVLDDRPKKTLETTCYGKAVFDGGEGFVILDGAESRTPATFTVPAHENDRVLVLLKNRKALVIGNITHPVIMTGTLYASDGIIVEGYLTTNELRTTYNNRVHEGLTFDSNGLGAYGSDGYWYVTTSGSLYVEQATVKGDLYAYSGEIGGFVIDQTSIHTKNKEITVNDSTSLGLSSAGFTRTVAGESRSNLMLAIGSGFGVNKDGTLYATGASISGAITATSLSLGSGVQIPASTGVSGLASVATSGNYDELINKIDKTAVITVNDSGVISIQKNNGVAKAGTITRTYGTTVKGFQISTDGLLEASNAVIYGTTYSSAGMIGGWGIENSRISTTYTANNTTYYIGMGTPGSQAFYAGATNQNGSNGVFRVDHLGNLTATSATITGAITATSLDLTTNNVKINATTSVSGLATVATSGKYENLTGTPDLTVYIAKDGTVGSTPAAGATGFKVASSGALTASNVIVWGSIYASGGTIAGWTIGSNKLTKGTLGANDSIQLGTADLGTATIADKSLSTWRLAVGSGFGVDKNGVLYAKGASISGTLTAGGNSKIGPWTVTDTSIWYGNAVYKNSAGIYLGTNGLSLSDKFYVGYDGIPYCMGADLYLCRSSIATGNGARIRFKLGTYEYGSIGIDSVGTDDNGLYLRAQYGHIYLKNNTQCDALLTFSNSYNARFGRTLTSWVSAFNHSAINVYDDGNSSSGAISAVTIQSKTGRLAISSYPSSDDKLYFSYITEGNYGSNTNTASQIWFDLPNRSITAASFVGALTGNVTGNCSGSSGSCTGHAAGDLSLTNGGTVSADVTIRNHVISTNTIVSTGGSGANMYYKVANASYGIRFAAHSYAGIYVDGPAIDGSGWWAFRIDSYGDIKVPSLDTRTYSTIIVSNSSNGSKVSVIGAESSTKVKIKGQFSGTSYDYYYATVSASSSDIRLKENIKESTADSLSLLNKIKLYSFNWKNTHEYWDVGFVANYIVDVDPRLASIAKTKDEFSSIDTFYMQGHIVKAIQQLTARIKYLESELEKVKGAA